MTKTTLLFAHGWGFDSSLWTAVADRLPDFARVFVDFGFLAHPPHHPMVPGAVVVGHSMGFAWSLANIPKPWAGAVSVNGFARFTRAPDFVSGVAPRSLERMISRFDTDPHTVTAEFLSRAGLDRPDTEQIKPKPLADALAWLAICDERAALKALTCPVLALGGTRDAIVSDAMTRESFAPSTLTLVEGASHLLPLSHPDWLATQIRLFVSSLP